MENGLIIQPDQDSDIKKIITLCDLEPDHIEVLRAVAQNPEEGLVLYRLDGLETVADGEEFYIHGGGFSFLVSKHYADNDHFSGLPMVKCRVLAVNSIDSDTLLLEG